MNDSDDKEKVDIPPGLDVEDIELLKLYNRDSYSQLIIDKENDIRELVKVINQTVGIEASDTGLSQRSAWNFEKDSVTIATEPPLRVATILTHYKDSEENDRYVIEIKGYSKWVVAGENSVAPVDIEEGMRVGVAHRSHNIVLPLPPQLDEKVSLMLVEEKPDVSYNSIGGCREQIQRLREIIELPLLQADRFIALGIEPPRGALLFGPPGTGKTLCARAVANETNATFIRGNGSELVEKHIGEGAYLVREIFKVAKSKKAAILFFDEIDAIGTTRGESASKGDNEVQRTMLELINQLDGFDARGNVKVLMATNRPDTLDPALMRPGRLDRKIEFGLPDIEGRKEIFEIHSKHMSIERDLRYDLLARLCPNSTGADIRSVCTEAGMFAIRERRKMATEKDFLNALDKVIKEHAKFSATAAYLQYN